MSWFMLSIWLMADITHAMRSGKDARFSCRITGKTFLVIDSGTVITVVFPPWIIRTLRAKEPSAITSNIFSRDLIFPNTDGRVRRDNLTVKQ